MVRCADAAAFRRESLLQKYRVVGQFIAHEREFTCFDIELANQAFQLLTALRQSVAI